jgi:hypothetical protein
VSDAGADWNTTRLGSSGAAGDWMSVCGWVGSPVDCWRDKTDSSSAGTSSLASLTGPDVSEV